jgi:proline iminopeptidase
MRARIRDTEIFFDVDGAGYVLDGAIMRERPTALLVHGGPGTDHTGWKARYSRLAEKMQLVYFDHRGHGRSARGDPTKYTLDENVEDMEALRVHLGLDSIVSIGGSYGGRVAMAHAARYPKSISHLILIATAAQPASLVRAEQIVRERGTPEQIAMSEEVAAGRIDTAEKLRRYFEVMGPLYSRKLSATALSGAGLGATILTPEPFNRAHGPNGFLHTLDLRSELGAITAPTLILAGRHDWRCAPEFSEEMHRLIPDSDLRIFEESGHTIGSDEPQQLLDAVAGFLVYRRRTRKS